MRNTERKEVLKNHKKTLKKDNLRYNEYYNMQSIFDNLYKQSQNNCKFNKLYNTIKSDRNILLAYRTIKRNHGSKTPGTNKHNIEYWEEKPIEEFLNYIKNRLDNYKPQKIKRVEIPKSNGKMRPLGIPCIEDRIIQQCIKQVLEPICEAKFHKNNYGFRPNRSTEHAITALVKKINQDHMYFAVDIDIKGFFDNVDHSKLLKQIWSLGIRDKKVICIISKMLKAEIEGIGIPNKGVPQGGILSPLLANIVLNELDWWISSQWETFPTKFNYKQNSHKFFAMKKTNLKEIYIIRYADDFKIICRNHNSAKKIYNATQKWLKERLNLDISPDKSKITDMRKTSSEFLGFKVKAILKRNKYVAYTSVVDKAIKNIEEKLRNQIKRIKQFPKQREVCKYNKMVAGMQNYYKIASNVYLDFKAIEYHLLFCLKQRLKSVFNNKGHKPMEYTNRYEHYGGHEYYIDKLILYPISCIKTRYPKGFNQTINNYTNEGREIIHSKLGYIDKNILNYLSDNPIETESIEYNDNKISLYSAQMGKCRISNKPLDEDMCVHRIILKDNGGDDRYKNLILVTPIIHALIHSINETLINYYLKIQKLSDKQLRILNQYRKKIGNEIIQ
ncbi:group II intron reverse transcriptase/maturase [Clostridium sp. P21]|uniref:Group II intron reverse transcriptase/maturase n=1 Tax=Clostridium muellerianum TaxID=2716538 RepID=A0A7Y0HQJ2_9CLOT|nr:group II intron reverse transcriptase/maturase [Clostridium muellerianum]NMM64802.1 group II intron reverse transcriptase/maturase [Clostridium muellerianum]